MDLLDINTNTKTKASGLTAGDIRAAMSKRWAEPEYAVMWEVSEATGAMRGRYADAVIMSLWPSRGLELHGVEIKVSRSDWKREAADPSKAEAIARFCDRWWIHTPAGIVDDLSALPPAWGLREFDGRAWKTIREAERTDAAPITRSFLAALLRRADGTMRAMVTEAARAGDELIKRERKAIRDRYSEDLARAVEVKTASLAAAAQNVALFETAFGQGSATSWADDFTKLGKAARALSKCGDNGYGSLAKRLRQTADEIDAIAAMSTAAAEEEQH